MSVNAFCQLIEETISISFMQILFHWNFPQIDIVLDKAATRFWSCSWFIEPEIIGRTILVERNFTFYTENFYEAIKINKQRMKPLLYAHTFDIDRMSISIKIIHTNDDRPKTKTIGIHTWLSLLGTKLFPFATDTHTVGFLLYFYNSFFCCCFAFKSSVRMCVCAL